MISVLVPVHDLDVVSLVKELNQQLNNLHVEGEILVFDDFSSAIFKECNKSLAGLKNVTYSELGKNYGRTAIRQLLASQAKFEWLLFLDGDSRIISADFLNRYCEAFKKGFDVYVGGRIYPRKPVDCNKRLHWKYGMKRESVKGNTTAFHTNNFCIRKEVFEQLNFPEFFKQYGHEDTWMGIELERLGKKILHIDNVVEHTNIENAEIFLIKARYALQSLLLLKNVTDDKLLRKHVSLFKAYTYAKQFHLQLPINFLYRSFEKKIIDNLNSCNPSLACFDLYRLYHLLSLSKGKG